MEAQFVVRAAAPDGTRERWITTPRRNGLRTFGPRDVAALFMSWDAAETAITEIRKTGACSEVEFEVQKVKPASQTAVNPS
jgi:hypothetical protein